MEQSIEQLKKEIQMLRENESRVRPVEKVPAAFEHMSMEEFREITTTYGENIKNIKNCENQGTRHLNFVQNVVKMMYPIDPIQLKKDYVEFAEKETAFLTAYYTTKQHHTVQITLRKRNQNISFFDISEESQEKKSDIIRCAVAADRKRSFRIDREPLIRVSVFKAEENLSFVVITQLTPEDGFQMANRIVNQLFSGAVLYKPGQNLKSVENRLVRERDERFWNRFLHGVQEQIHVPGYISCDTMYDKKSLGMISRETLLSGLQTYAAKLGVEVTDVFEAVWAVILYYYKLQPDVVFGIADGDSGEETLPLRAQVLETDPIEVLIRQIHESKQLMREHSGISVSTMEKLLGRETPLINHALSFHNLSASEGVKMADNKNRAVLLGMVTYAEERWSFCLHIRFLHERVAFNAIYNGCNYSRETIESLLYIFTRGLTEITEKEKMRIQDLEFSERSQILEIEEKLEAWKLQLILDMSKLPLFEQLPVEELEKIAAVSTVESCLSGDVPVTEGNPVETVDVILDGFVELDSTSREGWVRPVLLLNRGDVISNEWLLAEKCAGYSAQVMKDGTQLLRIPAAFMQSLLIKYSCVAGQIYRVEHERFRRMASLWIDIE